jgi:large subunit ribosomal protein L1
LIVKKPACGQEILKQVQDDNRRKEFMGKIRVKTLGIEETEKKQKQEAKKKAENKKLVKGAKGGERIVAVGPSEEELAQLEVSRVAEVPRVSRGEKLETPRGTRDTRKPRGTRKHVRSKNYQTVAKMVDKTKRYTLSEALETISKLKRAKFDETVELHINTTEKGISGNVTLPHGTGKKVKVAIADDELIAKVEKGKIDFDVLLAEPTFMPKLAKVAKFLGPRGLMPNPKNNTISTNPKTLAKKYEGGQLNFKTEAKAPIIHLTVGKVSYGAKKLTDNIKTMLEAIKKEKIRNVTLKSTMSPGIKIKFV